jgi:hypothetical protein
MYKNLIEHDELRSVVRESIHLWLNEMNKELIKSSMLCATYGQKKFLICIFFYSIFWDIVSINYLSTTYLNTRTDGRCSPSLAMATVNQHPPVHHEDRCYLVEK